MTEKMTQRAGDALEAPHVATERLRLLAQYIPLATALQVGCVAFLSTQ